MPERAVVVGGGVIGTMHAVEGVRRGFEVLHIEADTAPRRASVRNFGLVWVSGRQAGRELELALRARELWERLAEDVEGIGFRPDGSVTVAADESELAVMAELAGAGDASVRQVELLDEPGVRKVNPSIRGPHVGGLWCRNDAIVEPRRVLGAVRDALARSGRYHWHPGRRVVEVSGRAVADHTGERHRGDLVAVCVGDQLNGIGGELGAVLAAAPLRRRRLLMLETAPLDERLATAIADGDSMRYYPAFEVPALAELAPPSEMTRLWGLQLLLVQRAAGGLTIGDTHTDDDDPFDFAVEEPPYDDLRARAATLLGRPLPPTVRRWAGTYSVVTDGSVYYRAEVDGATVVTGPAGRGMTLSPAIAEETFEGVS